MAPDLSCLTNLVYLLYQFLDVYGHLEIVDDLDQFVRANLSLGIRLSSHGNESVNGILLVFRFLARLLPYYPTAGRWTGSP